MLGAVFGLTQGHRPRPLSARDRHGFTRPFLAVCRALSRNRDSAHGSHTAHVACTHHLTAHAEQIAPTSRSWLSAGLHATGPHSTLARLMCSRRCNRDLARGPQGGAPCRGAQDSLSPARKVQLAFGSFMRVHDAVRRRDTPGDLSRDRVYTLRVHAPPNAVVERRDLFVDDRIPMTTANSGRLQPAPSPHRKPWCPRRMPIRRSLLRPRARRPVRIH